MQKCATILARCELIYKIQNKKIDNDVNLPI